MTATTENLLGLVNQLIAEKQYEGVLLLFRPDKVDNLNGIKIIVFDLLEAVLPHLNDDNYKNNLALYTCCEELVKIVATNAGADDVLFELLQIVEETQSENAFTTALKALQICLLRLKPEKTRALEWTLNSIVHRIQDMEMPDYLASGYGTKQEKLLEQDDNILKLLQNYIILALFYDPLLEDVLKDKDDEEMKKLNRRNVLCCFFLQLLGKPFCYLDLTSNERKTNTYTMQCATSLVKGITSILEDPFNLLRFVREKVTNKAKPKKKDDEEEQEKDSEQEKDELSPENIFKSDLRVPIESMGIYYYLVIVEGISLESALESQDPLHIFETCLFLVTDFLTRQAPALQWRGLLLCKKTLENLGEIQISDKSLSEPIHQNFAQVLCQIIGYSPTKRHRQCGIVVLKKYIMRFSDESKCEILKTLVKNLNHSGLQGYLCTIYKDLVAERLSSGKPLSGCFTGDTFADFVLNHICVLKSDVETDLIEESDRIISALNAVRYFALTDDKNATGFWTFSKKIEKDFLDRLRMGINLSVAHYQLELQSLKTNKGIDKNYSKMAEMLNISALNGPGTGVSMDSEKKLEILNQSLTTFDLLRCLLARATECVEKRTKKSTLNQKK